jgi:DNA-binding response OmpR family regulator
MFVQTKKVLLAGLEPELAKELSESLRVRGVEIQSAPKLENANLSEADIVFCQTRQPGLLELLAATRKPVVVVSRLPEVNDWLDAMEAGAADYCAAPFEREQIDWILDSNLRPRTVGAFA